MAQSTETALPPIRRVLTGDDAAARIYHAQPLRW